MSTAWHIAQINTAQSLYDQDDPRFQGFVDQIDAINAIADTAPGFVWRLQDDAGNAMDIQVSDDPYLLINMSVWESIEALFEFTYKTAHTGVMSQRREWFTRPDKPHMAHWWVPAGTLPSEEEGMERLTHLREHGPTPHAFTFKATFPPPGVKSD